MKSQKLCLLIPLIFLLPLYAHVKPTHIPQHYIIVKCCIIYISSWDVTNLQVVRSYHQSTSST